MKKLHIPAMAIANRHPWNLKCDTDSKYANFANELQKIIVKQKIEGFDGDNARELAIVLTLYYEDVIADLGVWRAFTDRMQQLYGKFLPFYDIDLQRYYRDEPNMQDVRFLIWLFASRTEMTSILAPDTPALEWLARLISQRMELDFERMPVNEELKDFFADPNMSDTFYKQRDLLKWFCYTNYLTSNENAVNDTMNQAMAFSRNMKCPLEIAIHVAECVAVYESRVLPLALKPQEWLAMVLRHNGQEKTADAVEAQRYLPFGFYKVVKAEHEKGLYMESLVGEQFFVEDAQLEGISPQCYNMRSAMTFFVEYDGKFYLGTRSSWVDNAEAFDAEKRDHKRRRDMCMGNRTSLIEDNNGSPLYYFKNTESLKKFLHERIGMPMKELSSLGLDPTAEDFALFVRSADNNVCYFSDVARFIADPANPYYNAEYACNHAFGGMFGLPGDMLRYLHDKGLLPDAQINCSGGQEEGRRVVEENFDFFARMMQGNHY